MLLPGNFKHIAGISLVALGLVGFGFFLAVLQPVALPVRAEGKTFVVRPGDGFRDIADRLAQARLIRSAAAFKFLSVITGSAGAIKPGCYLLRSDASSATILKTLVRGDGREIEVRIPEGASLYETDSLLAENGILERGALTQFAAALSPENTEGRLFPDTYRFFIASEPRDVVQKFLAAFEEKAQPLLDQNPKKAQANLILASLIEREVPDMHDRRVVAGMLLKRLASKMPLQVDATVCYAKEIRDGHDGACHPITASDLKIDSPYNTYLYAGLPPGPIGSPGREAIQAALTPLDSPYWFYLSDPLTKKTIFSVTLEEHAANRAKYLK